MAKTVVAKRPSRSRTRKRTDPTTSFASTLTIHRAIAMMLCDLEVQTRLTVALMKRSGADQVLDRGNYEIRHVLHEYAAEVSKLATASQLAELPAETIESLLKEQSARVEGWHRALRNAAGDKIRLRYQQALAGLAVRGAEQAGVPAKKARQRAAEMLGLGDESTLRKWGVPGAYDLVDARIARRGGKDRS